MTKREKKMSAERMKAYAGTQWPLEVLDESLRLTERVVHGNAVGYRGVCLGERVVFRLSQKINAAIGR